MVFLDANIPLEIIMPDRLRTDAVRGLLYEHRDDGVAVSMLSVHLVWHFSRSADIPEAKIRQALSPYTVLSLEADDYAWALANEQGRDFEDALQVAAALRAGCDTFMTLDSKLARRYCELPLKFIVP